MAEGFLKKMLKEKFGEPLKIQVLSAGLNAYGWPVTREAAEAMEREEIDISGFRSKRLSQELVDKADLILTMEENHKDTLISLLPKHAHKIFTLKEFAGEAEDLNIHDPYGCGLEAYEACAKEIKQTLTKALDKIVSYIFEENENEGKK